MIKTQNSARQKCMRNVQSASFAVDEARLYLDTHPNDEKAKKYFDKYNTLRKKALAEYEANFSPILSDDINAAKDGWTWTDEPYPWNEGV